MSKQVLIPIERKHGSQDLYSNIPIQTQSPLAIALACIVSGQHIAAAILLESRAALLQIDYPSMRESNLCQEFTGYAPIFQLQSRNLQS